MRHVRNRIRNGDHPWGTVHQHHCHEVLEASVPTRMRNRSPKWLPLHRTTQIQTRSLVQETAGFSKHYFLHHLKV